MKDPKCPYCGSRDHGSLSITHWNKLSDAEKYHLCDILFMNSKQLETIIKMFPYGRTMDSVDRVIEQIGSMITKKDQLDYKGYLNWRFGRIFRVMKDFMNSLLSGG